MTYLVDTDMVADWLNNHAPTVQLLTDLRTQGLAISIITFGEIYEGIYFGRAPKVSEHVFRQFLRRVPVLPLSRRTMKQFARIRGELRRHGNLILDPDLHIAATALTHKLTLLTRNRAHFERIPGLILYPQN